MRAHRSRAVLLAALAGALACACGGRPLPPPDVPGRELVVLLPDADTGHVGAAQVSNAQGSVDLTEARDATTVAGSRAPARVATLSEDEVDRIFGDALSALPPPPLYYTLQFRFESDTLTDESRELVPRILQSVKERVVPDVLVVGHTDTAGPADANLTLGLQRAEVVRNLLIDAGLDPSAIEVISNGELDPLVPTPDDTPEPRNRRVEISVR